VGTVYSGGGWRKTTSHRKLEEGDWIWERWDFENWGKWSHEEGGLKTSSLRGKGISKEA